MAAGFIPKPFLYVHVTCNNNVSGMMAMHFFIAVALNFPEFFCALLEHCLVNPADLRMWDSDGTYRVIVRIVKAGCHPMAIAQVLEH